MNDKFKGIVDDFAKDTAKENGGVWMPYKNHEYLIARSHRSNTKFAKLMEERMRPYQWALDKGNVGAIKHVAEKVIKQVYAETILLGIRKLDKTPLDYQPADGEPLFTALPDLWDTIFNFAKDDGNYSPDAIEADSKNLSSA